MPIINWIIPSFVALVQTSELLIWPKKCAKIDCILILERRNYSMFQGFSKKTGEFLWELAFNNERPWFLAHKDEFEEYVNAPFKALAE